MMNLLMISISSSPYPYQTQHQNRYNNPLYHNIGTGLEASAAVINGSLHVIGGDLSNKHYIYIPKEQRFDIVHTFVEFPEGFSSHKVVHLKSKNVLLLLGGYDDTARRPVDTVYRYDITKNVWTKLETKIPGRFYRFGVAVSMDEQYVCLFGFCTLSKNGVIYVLDVKTMVFHKPNMECPSAWHEVVAVTVVDKEASDYLVIGYLRGLCKEYGIELPMDIMREMELWYGEEYIHVIAENGNHWKIKFNDILNNLE